MHGPGAVDAAAAGPIEIWGLENSSVLSDRRGGPGRLTETNSESFKWKPSLARPPRRSLSWGEKERDIRRGMKRGRGRGGGKGRKRERERERERKPSFAKVLRGEGGGSLSPCRSEGPSTLLKSNTPAGWSALEGLGSSRRPAVLQMVASPPLKRSAEGWCPLFRRVATSSLMQILSTAAQY